MSTSTEPLGDEIDLRGLVEVLIDGWRWIAAATIAGAVLAVGVSLLQPARYKASAFVVLTKPDLVFNFDPRITSQPDVPSSQGLPDLVTSGGILTEVLDEADRNGIDVDGMTIDDFQRQATASFSGTVLRLTFEDSRPNRSAVLANLWAELVAKRLNQVYAPSMEESTRFADQANDALARWQGAQQSLVEFQDANREGVIGVRLASQRGELRSYLTIQQSLSRAISDAQALIARLDSEDAAPSDPRNDLASLILTVNSLSNISSMTESLQEGNAVHQVAGGDVQLLVQIDEASFLSNSAAEQRDFLTDLIDSLQTQKEELTRTASDLEEAIPDLRGELTEAQEARQTLELQRDLAREAYEALARKAYESDLSTEVASGVAQIASRAQVPGAIVGQGLLTNLLLGALVSILLASFALVFLSWWQSRLESAYEK